MGWHLGAAVRGFNPDAVFGVLPSSDLRRVKPLVGERAVMGQLDDAGTGSAMLGETGAAAVACRLTKATVGRNERTLAKGIGKERLRRPLVPRVTVVLGR